MKTKTILLITSLIAFAVGFSDIGNSILSEMGRPVGAILLGLALIFAILEKETALLDEQNHDGSPRKISQKSASKSAEANSAEDFPIGRGATM